MESQAIDDLYYEYSRWEVMILPNLLHSVVLVTFVMFAENGTNKHTVRGGIAAHAACLLYLVNADNFLVHSNLQVEHVDAGFFFVCAIHTA